jgi:long-chain acyl-CoA synthetase
MTQATTISDGPGQSLDDGLALGSTNFCQAFQRTAARFAGAPALRTPGCAFEITWKQYADRVRRLAGGLAEHGVTRGSTVALMLTNRPEAFLLDTATLHLGAVPFSLYNTSSTEQLVYLLGHSEAEIVFTEAQFADRVLGAQASLPALRHVIVVDDEAQGTATLGAIEAPQHDDFDLEAAARRVSAADLVTLIYTSGTTGPPKGVELTHANLIAEWRLISRVLPLAPQGRVMSYLPLAHLADRIAAHYFSLISGACLTCVDNPRDAVAALPDVRPTVWMAVPRIWEKLKGALEPGLEGVEEAHFEAAATALRAKLGLDQAELLLSGAAPIAVEVLEFFGRLGLEIYEVWGMTETSAAATLSPKGAHRVGTVGKALPEVEVGLDVDGEILVRGPIVMRGYRKAPEETAAALDPEGWMRTGDIGTIDNDGYVSIIDRKKELIINSAGKNMSPANIENAIKAACSLIGSAVAIGDRRPFTTALIVLDPDAVAAYAHRHDISAASAAALAASAPVQEAIATGIACANERLSRVEQVKRHTLLPEFWEPGGDELTPTMKLRRKPIAEKYAAAIEAMYA